jgi:methionyl-tRNA synthetase
LLSQWISDGDEIPKFYVTTPIYYVTDTPHLGNAYATIIADTLARWHRLKGDDVFFLTGTDEHGSKIEKAAKAANMSTREFTDKIVVAFTDMWKLLRISNDQFIRTTDPHHEETVPKLIERIKAGGDLYLAEYEGWYCVPDETFFTDLQLKDGKCPECGRAVERLKEKSYFFRLSKYQDRLLKFYEDNPDFLSPRSRSLEVINRVKGGLKDLSISRSAVKWGVPFPGDADHTVYVWVDALINYLSALDWPDGKRFGEYWPADVHVVGKEINWFHSVIWPAMLFSAGIEPPKKVFAHGWWTVNGEKMSKSRGNGVDPAEVSRKYSVDAFRYFVMSEMPLEEDGDYSEKKLIARINGELVADLGNLLYRVLSLAEKFEGRIEGKPELDEYLYLASIDMFMEDVNPHAALEEVWKLVRAANKYVNDNKVWQLKGAELGNALYNLLESCRIIAILVSPFMPDTAEAICAQLGVKLGTLEDCRFGPFEGKVKKGAYLFKKVDVK